MAQEMLAWGRQATDWQVVYTRHRHEKSVAESFVTHGIEAYLPLYESARRWKDRTKQLSLPLFPCYVFLRGFIERRADVLSTPGVHSVIKFGNQVASLPHTEVEAIRRAVESRLHVEPHPFLEVGERVRIKSGPLIGIEGIIMRRKGGLRLILSAALLEKSVAVEIDAFSIEPTAPRSPSWPSSCAWTQAALTP
jgi:transcription antitermination factor NusG